MHLGTIEALKTAVASNLGMSIVPDVAVAGRAPDIIVRPLQPPVPCTLALIEHRNKPDEPALEIVRKALLELREDAASERPASAPARSPPLGCGRLAARRAELPGCSALVRRRCVR